MSSNKILDQLRAQMKQHQLEAYWIPMNDAHSSEYVHARDKRITFLSGFTGSDGDCIVSQDGHAALWVDGRYHLQAPKEVDELCWTVMKMGKEQVPSKEEWLAQVIKSQGRVGIHAKLISVTKATQLKSDLAKKELQVVFMDECLIDKIWVNQPAYPLNKIEKLDMVYCGQDAKEKIEKTKNELIQRKAYGIIISALDEIAWLFNLRGSDVECNPVFLAYAVVTRDDVILYVNIEKLSENVQKELIDTLKVIILPYEAIYLDLKKWQPLLNLSKEKFMLSKSANFALQSAIGEKNTILIDSFLALWKALKNEVELQNIRIAHLKDAAALCEFFAWLEQQIHSDAMLTENDLSNKLLELRSKQPEFMDVSFPSIVGSGANGAFIHYRPKADSSARINKEEMILIDSGGQYKNGTTDVTRTIHLGEPTAHEKRCFTRVLQGHIEMDRLRFPKTHTGYQIECIARIPLWNDGLDFAHGVGHGVGQYLNVHEGPHGLSQHIRFNDIKLQAGMTVTNDPGYYETNQFGIRIENVMFVRPDASVANFLCFEHVTLVPIQKKLIDIHLLTNEQIQWLNDYHLECLSKVLLYLTPDSAALQWLERETSPIPPFQ